MEVELHRAEVERGEGGVNGSASCFAIFVTQLRGFLVSLGVLTRAVCCLMVDWWKRSTMRNVDRGNCCRRLSLRRGTRRLPRICQRM